MYRKVKEDPSKKEVPADQKKQLLTRSRVREHNKNQQRNSWLNKAIIVVIILLLITIYAVLKW